MLATSPRPASLHRSQAISFVSCWTGPRPELLGVEEGDLGALDILTPLLLMRKLNPENLQEQVAGTQARNQVLSVSSEAHTFLPEKRLQMNGTVSASPGTLPHFSPGGSQRPSGETKQSSQARYLGVLPDGLTHELLPDSSDNVWDLWTSRAAPPFTYLL